MSTATPDKLMTIEEFHALPPDENVERELIRGVLWEEPKTRRNRWHAEVENQSHLPGFATTVSRVFDADD